jgi:glutathione S-transferase
VPSLPSAAAFSSQAQKKQPPPGGKPVFFDMVHSNNAARIRIFIRKKGLDGEVDSKMILYPDLQKPEYLKINPCKKVPAFIQADGACLFESNVILGFLEDKYSSVGPNFTPTTPEARALVQLFCRIHDLYIASPNITQPGYSHTQGSMYLAPYATQWCPAERVMDMKTRTDKLAEIWKQLSWLEANLVGPYCAGSEMTTADMTWYPTLIFMEYMLPRVFEWPEVFHEDVHFPRLRQWFELLSSDEVCSEVRENIWNYWVTKDQEGQFDSIRSELKGTSLKYKYP